jgi:ABC-type lipoprotein release transport system permease subunit
MEAMGMTMEPQLTQSISLRALRLTAVISLMAGGYPALLAARLNLAEALRRE